MKKIDLKLVGMDGNAFFIMGAFQKQAKKEGWTKAEIDAVLNDAQSGDYNHLLSVITDHCINPAGKNEEYEWIDNEFDDDEEEEYAGLRTWRGETSNV